ncbi:hypothetical protein HNP38_002030 [Chryseobacterium defluvii]|uniref:Uncharacterized protein n=1 Tax=Chryseobacterium defluvii TaxID=160396 RepID=A0A840KGA5_9FLAO|nr:hypothetical protein [Chryseobacterium defluvii]MBB4806734.1 hypothetical protein [Chryseobacterium defluvii]
MDIFHFANNELNARVCNYPYGKKAAFVQNSDTHMYPNEYLMFIIAMKHNIRMTTFINPYDQTVTVRGLKEGICDYDIYFPTDRWKNPVSGTIEIIPDYYGTAWTSAGASIFANAQIGQPKATRAPNHGQELFDISNGSYGYNFSTGIAGTTNLSEFKGLTEYLIQWFEELTGKKPVSFSYRNGQNGGSLLFMPYFLGGRNSDLLQTNLTQEWQDDFGRNNNGIYLGSPQQITSRSSRINQRNSSRVKDMASNLGFGTWAEVLEYAKEEMAEAVNTGGAVNDFIHRNQYSNDTTGRINFDNYLKSIDELPNSGDIWRWSYGEMLQYLFVREIADKISAKVQDNKILIVANKKDKYKSLFTSGIPEALNTEWFKNAFLSVEIDLTGTFLEGKNIKATPGTVYSLGNNKYTIQIPFRNLAWGVFCAELTEAESADYIDLSRPVISNIVRSGNTISFETNKDCIAWLAYYDTTLHASFGGLTGVNSNPEFKKIWSFDISTITNYSNKKFLIAVADKEKQSNVSSEI